MTVMFPHQRNRNMILTKREIEVISSVADGNKQSVIAELLDISSDTVNAHLDKIREKLNAKNTSNAVAKAFREKIIT